MDESVCNDGKLQILVIFFLLIKKFIYLIQFPQAREFKDNREAALDARDEDRDIKRSDDRYRDRD